MAAAATAATSIVGVSSARSGSIRSRARSTPVVCCQQPQNSAPAAADRRSMVGLVAAGSAAALVAGVVEQPPAAQAAYGEAANVFGKVSNASGFLPYAGDGYAVLLPSKWNPSKEQPFPGVELYYEDNFDAVTNMIVSITPSSKKEISEYGSPDQFLKKVAFLFGEQTFSGKTKSEGGFAENKVSVVNLLDLGEESKGGKKYYNFEVLTRTADGDEGGRHQLITATVSDGALFILKAQAGDKRWFKGSERVLRKVVESFQVV